MDYSSESAKNQLCHQLNFYPVTSELVEQLVDFICYCVVELGDQVDRLKTMLPEFYE
jgi:hypothetical protein